MKGLTLQLESQRGSNEKLFTLAEELKETKIKLNGTEEMLSKVQEECNKVKADKKVVLEHDQVSNESCILTFLVQPVFLNHGTHGWMGKSTSHVTKVMGRNAYLAYLAYTGESL